MGKRAGKLKQRLMVLLTSICILGSMPYTTLSVSAEETISGNELISEQSGEETTGQTQAAESESGTEEGEDIEMTEDTDADGSRDDEEDTLDEPEDGETGDSDGLEDKGTEESEESEDTDTENPEEESEDETDAEESAAEEDAEAVEDTEAEESDPTDELEDEEDAEESIMLLSAENEISTVAEQETDSIYTDEQTGVKYHYYGYDDGTANIYELESYKGNAVNIPTSIGDYTVTQLSFVISTASKVNLPTVTIPETVIYIGGSAFKYATIGTVYYDAIEADIGAGSVTEGCFYSAEIDNIVIGSNVKVLPDYLFSGSYVTLDELTINAETIGEDVFFRYAEIKDLTIGENVSRISIGAFHSIEINNLHFNAIHAEAVEGNFTAESSAVFSASNLATLTFGEKVEVIPDGFIRGVKYTADSLEIPDSVTKIGAYAFYGTGFNIGELTIGENITSIGREAFANCNIGTLNFNAIESETPGLAPSLNHRNPFGYTKIGELCFGSSVRAIPDYIFYCSKFTQDKLVIPDSVVSIGKEAISNQGYPFTSTINIGTLEVGENVLHIGEKAFAAVDFEKAVVYATKSDGKLVDSPKSYVPKCDNVEIHGNSAYYKLFTTSTEFDNITLLCEDFDTTYGDEYFDEDTSTFVTQVTDTCTVCGYEMESEEHEDGFTVIFEDYDGRELSRQHVKSGADATAPEEPERTGYEFTGWDRGYTDVIADVTVRAQYKILMFHVVFKDGEKTISDQEIDYGGSAIVPEDPTRPAEEWGNWKFTGWQGNYEDITQDETLYAQFEKVLNEYEVIFYDADGKELDRQTVKHGNAAKTPEVPVKESTPQYSYTFKGWDGDTDNITGNVSFHPTYEAKTRSYTVTFMNGSTAYDTQTVEYGKAATAPSDPVREPDGKYTYKFLGWDGDYSFITGDTVIYAQFEKEEIPGTEEPGGGKEPKESYTVIFADHDGTELSRQSVYAGEDATPPDMPERTGYQFIGWDKEYINIMSDLTITAQYKIRSYTVIFRDGDTVISKQEVEYGSDATVPEDPTRPAEDWGRWRFTGWDGRYTDIAQDVTIYAKFEKVFHEYEVVFHDADGNVLSRQTVTHGSGAKVPNAPAKEATAQYQYIFTGWDGDTENITRDSSFYPVYEARIRTYTVTFMNGGKVLEKQAVEYGKAAAAPSSPEKEADGEYTYRFTGWDKDYSFVTGDMTIYAMFEKIKNTETEEGDENKIGKDQGQNTENKDDTGEEETDTETGLVLDILLPKMKKSGLTLDLKTGTKQKTGTETVGPIQIELETEDSIASPEMEETEDAGDTPEDDIPPVDSGDAEETEITEETVMEDGGETGKTPSCLKQLLFFAIILISAVMFILLFLFLRKRKVCGTVFNAEGEPMYGMRVTLAGKDTLVTYTDEDGHFSFDGLKKGIYRLDIFKEEEEAAFSMDISMKEKEVEDIFHVLTSNHSSLETEVKGIKYTVDVAV